jgi:hypothetical protein
MTLDEDKGHNPTSNFLSSLREISISNSQITFLWLLRALVKKTWKIGMLQMVISEQVGEQQYCSTKYRSNTTARAGLLGSQPLIFLFYDHIISSDQYSKLCKINLIKFPPKSPHLLRTRSQDPLKYVQRIGRILKICTSTKVKKYIKRRPYSHPSKKRPFPSLKKLLPPFRTLKFKHDKH